MLFLHFLIRVLYLQQVHLDHHVIVVIQQQPRLIRVIYQYLYSISKRYKLKKSITKIVSALLLMLKLVHRQYHHRLIQVADPVQRALFPYVSIIYEKTHKKMDIIRYLTIFESALSILLIATTIGTILIHCILLSIVSK